MQKSEYLAAYYQANRDRILEQRRAYREANREKVRETVRKCWNDPDKKAKYLAKRAEWYEGYAPIARERTRKWLKENADKRTNVGSATYKAAKLKRKPAWLSKEDRIRIKEMYRLAARLTAETGVKHHVDHIIPLRGKTVSGLHVPSNLQIITASENQRKLNRYAA